MIDRERYRGMVRCLNCRFSVPKRQENINETTVIFCNFHKSEKIDHAVRHCKEYEKKAVKDTWVI